MPTVETGKKAEQRAFAGKGLDYVTDVYLPERLGDEGGVNLIGLSL